MGKDYGFLEYERREPGCRPREERLRDYRGVERRMSDRDVNEQAARCMDCGVPFCHGCGCPLANLIPELNDHVYHDRWRAALELLLATNPFPEFTGRICPAPCEAACVAGLHGAAVTVRQIELAIVEKGFERGYIAPHPPARRLEQRVAVVGSGPAGLAVADRLNRYGVQVVVYESAPRPGGILRYGIPEFKLEKRVLDRRIRLMEAEGIRFESGVEVGRDVSYRYLRDRFDAVVLTGGAREPRDLRIPGRDLRGIHFAMPFLVQQNLRLEGAEIPADESIHAGGKRVLIIGGGDTGADCLGTALRQGARRVYQFEILPRPPAERAQGSPWPMWPDKMRSSSSHEEGGEREWCVSTKAFLGQNGKLQAARCCRVEWSAAGGRRQVREREGTEFLVEAELAILSMGFCGPGRNRLVEEQGVERDERGYARRDARHMTSVEGLFVAGDMALGASLVVRAIADGRRVAAGVVRFLGIEMTAPLPVPEMR